MSHYARIVVAKPLAAIESALLAAFEAPSLIPVDTASDCDFLISEAPFGTALDENGEMQFFPHVSHDPDLLCKLSTLADTEVRAIAVQTGAVSVDILVANRGKIIRRYSGSVAESDIDEGQLPEWDEQIRKHAWNAADSLVGIFPPERPPGQSFLGRLATFFRGQPAPPRRVDAATEQLNKRRREMDFNTPVAAISPAQFYLRKDAEAASRMVKPARVNICSGSLDCELSDQTHVQFDKVEIKEVRPHPFDPNRLVLLLHDNRSIWLPPEECELQAYIDWLK